MNKLRYFVMKSILSKFAHFNVEANQADILVDGVKNDMIEVIERPPQ